MFCFFHFYWFIHFNSVYYMLQIMEVLYEIRYLYIMYIRCVAPLILMWWFILCSTSILSIWTFFVKTKDDAKHSYHTGWASRWRCGYVRRRHKKYVTYHDCPSFTTAFLAFQMSYQVAMYENELAYMKGHATYDSFLLHCSILNISAEQPGGDMSRYMNRQIRV